MSRKKVFVSYSWSSEEYAKKILNIANGLVEQFGVDVVIDKWDLKAGDDKFAFMERMVNAPDIDYVLLFCDKIYQERANNRVGGVGTETQIITSEIYDKIEESKFIPVIMERDKQSGKEFLPTFVKNKIYFDFTNVTKTDYETMEEIARFVYDKPLIKKPKLAAVPEFTQENNLYKLDLLVQSLGRETNSASRTASVFQSEFLVSYYSEIDNYNITETDLEKSKSVKQPSEFIYEKIVKSVPLIEHFNEAIKAYVNSGAIKAEVFIAYFEDMVEMIEKEERVYFLKADLIRFLLHESILNIVHLLLERNEYAILSNIILSDYMYMNRENEFTILRMPLESLRQYNEVSNLNKISMHGYVLKNRYNSKKFKQIQEADLFLYFVTKLNPYFNDQYYNTWYPVTSVYLNTFGAYGNNIFNFRKLKNLKFKDNFDKMQCLFGLSVEEFRENVRNFEIDKDGFRNLPDIRSFLNIDDIATM